MTYTGDFSFIFWDFFYYNIDIFLIPFHLVFFSGDTLYFTRIILYILDRLLNIRYLLFIVDFFSFKV